MESCQDSGHIFRTCQTSAIFLGYESVLSNLRSIVFAGYSIPLHKCEEFMYCAQQWSNFKSKIYEFVCMRCNLLEFILAVVFLNVCKQIIVHSDENWGTKFQETHENGNRLH